eukprot:233883_1
MDVGFESIVLWCPILLIIGYLFRPNQLCICGHSVRIIISDTDALSHHLWIIPLYATCLIIMTMYIHIFIFCILSTLFLLLLFHLMISLGILFIYKLITVYRNGCIASNDVYVCAITRTTILCSISISMSFVAIIGCTFYHLDTSNHTAVWLTRFLTLADVYSNTLCVVMCYKCFLPIYDKLCIHLDAMCRRCWIKIVRDDTRDIKVQTDCDFTEDKTTNTVTTTDRIFMHETTV